MTINHRAEAEKQLANAARHLTEHPGDMRIAEVAAAIGQGHAALARDEEQAARTADMRDALRLLRAREYDVREAVSTHIAKALASREPNRWKAGRELAQALDMADCNVDDAIDARLSDDGWDPRGAWKAPADGGGWIAFAAERAPKRDPWGPAPDITDAIPENIRRIIAEQLADMLLNGDSETVQLWARNFTYALKNEGADLTGDIEKRITELTLGRDPSDPPF
ncbi:hypothetical protein [Streptomyces sp. NEAU-174]|uniref:hypothetical protein n=1 Tax=Streptomyces sp. NEAU-174 TaxID=3458254 RepID=UPI0040451919